jgi:hypothetical protein
VELYRVVMRKYCIFVVEEIRDLSGIFEENAGILRDFFWALSGKTFFRGVEKFKVEARGKARHRHTIQSYMNNFGQEENVLYLKNFEDQHPEQCKY